MKKITDENEDILCYETFVDQILLHNALRDKLSQGVASAACMGGFFHVRGIPGEREAICSFSFLLSTLCRPLFVALGAGLGVWGVVNLLEGYGSDNPGANAHVP